MIDNEYIVYIDVFFMINFVMDYIILRITKMFLKDHHNKLRLIAASLFGAGYSIIAIIIPRNNHLLLHQIFMIITSYTMIYISFGFQNTKKFILNGFYFYAISFLMGGCMNALYYSTAFGCVINEILKGETTKGLTIRTFLVVTVISYFVQLSAKNLIEKHKIQKNIYDVTISYRGKEYRCKALFDTGNSLCDPISGEMVHIIKKESVYQLLSQDSEKNKTFRIIPFHSIGKDHGIMYAYKFDKMTVSCTDQENSCTNKVSEEIVLESPLIALFEGELSCNGAYEVILNMKTF